MTPRVLAVSLALSGILSPCALADEPASPQPATPDREAEVIRTLCEQKNAPLVTIKFVLKNEDNEYSRYFGGGDEGMEATGVMIDPKGIVLVSSSSMGNWMSAFSRSSGRRSTPTDIKVLVGDDTDGVEAKIIARDSELDLSWLRIDKEPAKPYTHVDFSQPSSPNVGDKVYTVHRAGKFYDRAPMVYPTRILGKTSKPRELLLGGGGGDALPIYTGDGKVVGISVRINLNREESEGMMGGMGSYSDMYAPTILPAKDVAEATKNAMETAAANPAGEAALEETPDAGDTGETPPPAPEKK